MEQSTTTFDLLDVHGASVTALTLNPPTAGAATNTAAADAAEPLARPLRRDYDANFALSADYQASLPDLMAGNRERGWHGARAAIVQVGISGFKLPVRFATRTGAGGSGETAATLEARVTGTVGLPANQRAINMSRIIRVFYEFQDETFTLETLPRVLARMQEAVGCSAARLRLDFSYPLRQVSLRSETTGWQFYDVAFEAEATGDGSPVRRRVRFDFVYSSACPCSSELSEHARETRAVFAIPHSQRSRARVWTEVAAGKTLTVEDLHGACLRALKTETQVIVRRPDEQAFAELNGANVKFVEDAARLVYAELEPDARIADFQVACVHLESLHSHDAVAVICKGVPGGYFRGEWNEFAAMAR